MIDWLKKKYNILSKSQKEIVIKEAYDIVNILNVKKTERYDVVKKEREKFEYEETVCKKCNSDKSVNKIINVLEKKTSRYSRRFIFQQPIVNSQQVVVEKNMTECSQCGNQWKPASWYKRYNYDYYNRSYNEIFHEKINKKHTFDFDEFYKDYKDFMAESMYYVFYDIVDLKTFRKLNKSIFDK